MQKNQAPNRANKSLLIGLGILITVIASAMIYLCLMKAPSAHAADYPIQGFDVSHHQKEIQWQQISPEKYRFVYLKATEAATLKIPNFRKTGSRPGNAAFWSVPIISTASAAMAAFRHRTLSMLSRINRMPYRQ